VHRQIFTPSWRVLNEHPSPTLSRVLPYFLNVFIKFETNRKTEVGIYSHGDLLKKSFSRQDGAWISIPKKIFQTMRS
jgi:hypothetical protein